MTTAVVAGGSTGIGLAIVRALLDQGVVDDVVVWDLGHAAEEPLLAESEQVACDVTDVDSVRAAYTGLARPVDILVNKAGGDPNPPGAREGGLAAPDPFGSAPFSSPRSFRRSTGRSRSGRSFPRPSCHVRFTSASLRCTGRRAATSCTTPCGAAPS